MKNISASCSKTASFSSTQFIPQLFFVISLFHVSFATRKLTELFQEPQTQHLDYHKGHLLFGKTFINLIWYGKFKPSHRAIISDFITSLSSSSSQSQLSVATWWKTTETYYHLANAKRPLSLYLGEQILEESYSLGKSLTQKQLGKNYRFAYIWVGKSETQCPGYCAWLFHQPIYGPQTPPLGAPNNDLDAAHLDFPFRLPLLG
ncbi:unnamed protein product, partial [Ilex paraguariensis]